MKLFSRIESLGHEQVVVCHDPASKLRAIIAIHDTTLGPSLGGTRLLPYENEDDALTDVLRLSRGMTYKAACAGLSLGGGKAVIIADPKQKTEQMFRAFGRFIDSLGGRYITAEDMNTNVTNMDHIRLETRYVTGVSTGLGGSGDPSIMTAKGIFYGIQEAVNHRLGKRDLNGVKISLQGVGSVGKHLCKMLYEKGVKLFVTDIDDKKLKEIHSLYNATIVAEKDFYSLDVDLYAPCARGATLNSNNIQILKAKIVAGCANNQLEDEDKHSKMLKDMKILYAPDYVINAGGLINVANEITGYDPEKVENEVARIANTLDSIFNESDKQGVSTHEAAKRFAENRIQNVANLKNMTKFASSAIGNLKK
ncbi:Glu/Leu/Phe/Val dehydrogenase dimerization domain-containing protein [Silvanigrella aquatica]|uniref:Leucine dehydrogenase n=1 Tax=Silvanigrella aquatica TaxID=1915309 RepID=A0A1L4D012_9BACT|nr:Glu/Leu/Phe/Val dehydrogenase dimerization domain-containing protein [Silvanigrella aquatica]APJ03520.1 leucine dehydrogenase [Silvanigrella aquatica]